MTPPPTAPSLFLEFMSAGAATQASSRDVLDDIRDWLATTVPRISKIRAEHRGLQDDGQKAMGERFPRYSFNRHCDADELSKECWDITVRLVENDFISPQHVEVGNVEKFIMSALGCDELPREDELEAFLLRWDPSAIRTHFKATVGDVREAALTQLRDRVLDWFGSTRPDEVTSIWCHIHEPSHRAGLMRRTYQSRNTERFAGVLSYIVHLATGQAPGEIVIPAIFGYNDGASEWDRAELFRRQKNPFPGCEWLRFAADGYLQIKLVPDVLARLQIQYDERKRDAS